MEFLIRLFSLKYILKPEVPTVNMKIKEIVPSCFLHHGCSYAAHGSGYDEEIIAEFICLCMQPLGEDVHTFLIYFLQRAQHSLTRYDRG